MKKFMEIWWKEFRNICLILLILFSFQENANGFLTFPMESSNSGYIEKQTIKKADLICIGRTKEIYLEKGHIPFSQIDFSRMTHILNKDAIEIERFAEYPQYKQKITVKGDWYIAKVLVDTVIRNEDTNNNKEIKVRFFFSLTSDYSLLFDIPRSSDKMLLFLKKIGDDLYSFVKHSGSLIELPSVDVDLNKVQGTEKRIKTVLLQALEENGNTHPKEGIIYTLNQLDIDREELISLYKELTMKVKPEMKDLIISTRLKLSDTTVLKDILEISKNETYSKTNFQLTESVMVKMAIPENLPVFVEILASKNTSLREGAILALSEIKDKSVIPYLIKALDNKSNFVKFRAVIGLTNILGPMIKDGKFVLCPLENPNENGCVDLWKNWWEKEGKKEYGEPERAK